MRSYNLMLIQTHVSSSFDGNLRSNSSLPIFVMAQSVDAIVIVFVVVSLQELLIFAIVRVHDTFVITGTPVTRFVFVLLFVTSFAGRLRTSVL